MSGHLVGDPGCTLTNVAKVRVLYADTDAMGVVYHAAYLPWLEHGRVELLRQIGLTYREVAAQGWGLPVTECAVRYLAPARYDDQLTLHVGISSLGRVRVHFAYLVTIESGDRADLTKRIPVLRGETRHACVRAVDGRPVRLPDEVYAHLRTCYTGA